MPWLDTDPPRNNRNGIGLAIVQRHGGTVLAKGIPGESAVYSFSLPAQPPDAAPTAG